MCLGVAANGWGTGKGTHVGVAVYMMKGESVPHLIPISNGHSKEISQLKLSIN